MGIVYKARQLGLDRTVAVKMILGSAPAVAAAGERFRAEAQAIARLHHPNVVQVHAVGEHDGRAYLVMEFVAGGGLAGRLDGSPWQPHRAAGLVEVLAGGIAAAHRVGVVHRDLKPSNILLADDGAPKIADFGLAKLMDSDSELTRTGALLGSPMYMAPEQAMEQGGAVGPPADIHALGVILYELLTGRPPYRGATITQTLEQVRSSEPVLPSRLVPHLPRDVETICLKCLEKDPERRYGDAGQLADDLRRYLDGRPILARPTGRLERAARWARRRPVVAGLIGALAAAVISLAGLGLWSYAAIRWRWTGRGKTSGSPPRKGTGPAPWRSPNRTHGECRRSNPRACARPWDRAGRVGARGPGPALDGPLAAAGPRRRGRLPPHRTGEPRRVGGRGPAAGPPRPGAARRADHERRPRPGPGPGCDR